MTITDPAPVVRPRRPQELAKRTGTNLARGELVRLVRELRSQAYRAGERIPGRPTLAKKLGVSTYRVRQALEEIDREQPRPHECDRDPVRDGDRETDGFSMSSATSTDHPSSSSSATPPEPQSPGDPPSGNATTPPQISDERPPIGASQLRPSPTRAVTLQRDVAGSIARTAVLISMFILAAAVWVKAAELSGHQIELAVIPVLDWPVRLAYFAPILVEGAVYAAIRTCHTLDYVREATRTYARRTAVIGLVAMVVVGVLVGLGFADEPYVRDGIGGLIGGLGPYMGWRTSRASAMVAGDRRAAAEGPRRNTDVPPPGSTGFVGLLDTLATTAAARVAKWSQPSGQSATPSAHEEPELTGRVAGPGGRQGPGTP